MHPSLASGTVNEIWDFEIHSMGTLLWNPYKGNPRALLHPNAHHIALGPQRLPGDTRFSQRTVRLSEMSPEG